MKILSYILVILVITSSALYYGCDDSGTIPIPLPTGQITLKQTNLKPLDQGTDGWYQLWIALDTANQREWFSAGEFNISSGGTLVDLSGAPVTLKFTGDTNRLTLSAHALITVEKSTAFAPGPLRLLSGPLTLVRDSIYGSLKMSGSEALDAMGTVLIGDDNNCPTTAPNNCASGYYVLQSPTTSNADCLKGLWFADVSGNSSFTAGLDLPSGLGWTYEAWVVQNSTQTFHSLGRFTRFTQADSDGPGSCPGSNPVDPFNNVPGEEYAAGCTVFNNLNNGDYGVFITLEPINESGASLNSPFPLKMFRREVIQSSLNCGNPDVFFRAVSRDCLQPYAILKIAR
ncbi:MAG: hypothetical protein ABI543_02250 [Ignavibacteria bacterium]